MDLKKAVLSALGRGPMGGLRAHDLAGQLDCERDRRRDLDHALDALVDERLIERSGAGRYRLTQAKRRPEPGPRPVDRTGGGRPGAEAAPTGRIRVHPAGYAFVVREDGEEDVYVGARNRGAALDGDRVRLTTWVGYKGTEGRVTEVVERGRARVTGVLAGSGRSVHLEPDDPRIAAAGERVVLPEGGGGAKPGQAVVAEITRYPSRPDEPLEARISAVLGDPDDPRTEVAKVLVCADIPTEFAPDTLEAARHAPAEVRPVDLADRVDLRDREFITCDPETARDFDDAICVEREGDGPWRLWVAIADVSHYVRPGVALDREARARGCSVYLPDRAIAMLPHELSAGICSLNPEVDRLAMVARLDIDDAGEVIGRQLCAGVIRSRARLDYAGVAAALAGDFRGARSRYRPWEPALRRAKQLADLLRRRRVARGALDFDLPEPFVELDRDDPRLVRDVRRSKPSPEIKEAYRLVEDFMLAANEAVAEFFRERQLDTMWRIHEPPSAERVEVFATLAEALGVPVSIGEETLTPKRLQEILAELAGRPSERALSYLLLRSLKQAQYDVVNVGHFGLASRDYLHFTSPIRRYPDLIVHRLLKYQLHREGVAAGLGAERAAIERPPPRKDIAQMAVESSAAERRAMEAEREVVDMYRALLMRDRVGEELDGRISGVASFGFFVEVDQPFVEGLVRTETLGPATGDAWVFDEQTLRLIGRRSGRAFALGDEVRVRVENVSVQRRRIELTLVSGGSVARGSRPREERRPERPRDRRRREELRRKEQEKRRGGKGRPGRRERERRKGRE